MSQKERGFHVPATLRDSIRDALATDREYLLPHELSLAEDIAAGRTAYSQHIEWLQEYFSSIDVQYLLHGGDEARTWLDKVNNPTTVVSSAFSGRDEWVYFVAGPQENSYHADSLYTIDPKTETVYSWSGNWNNLGPVSDIDIDRPFVFEVDFTTAKNVAEFLLDPNSKESSIDIREVDPVEYNIFRKAEYALDYKILDRMSEFITVNTGEDPNLVRERSKNAQKQVRDGSGRFSPSAGGGSSSSSSSGASTPSNVVDSSGKKPESADQKTSRLAETFKNADQQLDNSKRDPEAVQQRIDSDQVRAQLEGAENSAQPADVFIEEFKSGKAKEVDNRDEKNRPRTTFADEASYEPDPEAIRPTDISSLPPESKAYAAIVDKDDHNAVLNLAVVAKAEGKVFAFVRMNEAWYEAPELLAKFNSADPPYLVHLEDETQIASVIEQVDASDAPRSGGDDSEETSAPSEDEQAIAAAIMAYEQEGNEAYARDAVILASLTGNHRLLNRDIIIASGLGLLDAREVDDYGTILSAGVPGVADTPSDYAASRRLKNYWLHGPGAAKIRWGTGGDFTRCVRHLRKYLGARAKGYCAERHHDAVGFWPGDKRNK